MSQLRLLSILQSGSLVSEYDHRAKYCWLREFESYLLSLQWLVWTAAIAVLRSDAALYSLFVSRQSAYSVVVLSLWTLVRPWNVRSSAAPPSHHARPAFPSNWQQDGSFSSSRRTSVWVMITDLESGESCCSRLRFGAPGRGSNCALPFRTL